jgi:hypothetical protein
MSDANIKIGDINVDNKKGIVNLLAVSEDIRNAITGLDLPSSIEKSNAKELLRQLGKEIEDSSDLNEKQKVKALNQVKELVQALKVSKQPDSDSSFQENAENAITLIKGIVSGVSSTASIFKLLSDISSVFGIL